MALLRQGGNNLKPYNMYRSPLHYLVARYFHWVMPIAAHPTKYVIADIPVERLKSWGMW